MGRIVAIVAVAIVITLGVLIGTRLSADSIALIVGVLIGMTASIPTGFLFAWAFSRRGEQQPQRMGTYGSGQYPPVVVVNPGAGAPWQAQPQAPAMLPAPSGPRSYEVIGDFSEEERHAER